MIYYVEDDPNIRELTSYALRQAGFEAACFPDPEGSFAASDERRPDLVLLDIMLPGIDGLEILRRLRADEATEHVPVMMLTAKGAEYDKVSGYLTERNRHAAACKVDEIYNDIFDRILAVIGIEG